MELLYTKSGTKLYPLGDSHQNARFGYMRNLQHGDPTVMAINSYKFGCPKKGQWFLSGAQPTAYKAPNNLSTAYWIAKIVQVEKVIEHKIVGILNN